jgi:hypothetical protein
MREGSALSADQSPRPPLSSPEQGDGKQPELPRLHFPQRPDGQGLAPAPGGYPPPAPPPPAPPPRRDGQTPPPGNAPPGNAPPGNVPPTPPGAPPDWANRWAPQQGPTGPGPRRPPGPSQPLRPPEPTTRQRAIAALSLGVLSLLALLAAVGNDFNVHRGIFLVIFALAVSIGACWFGITAMRRARLSVTMRPRGAVAGIVLGVIGFLLSGIMTLGMVAYWPQLNTFSQCLHEANTPSAQQGCLNQLDRSVEFGRLSG